MTTGRPDACKNAWLAMSQITEREALKAESFTCTLQDSIPCRNRSIFTKLQPGPTGRQVLRDLPLGLLTSQKMHACGHMRSTTTSRGTRLIPKVRAEREQAAGRVPQSAARLGGHRATSEEQAPSVHSARHASSCSRQQKIDRRDTGLTRVY